MRTLEQTLRDAREKSRDGKPRFVVEDTEHDPGNPFSQFTIVKEGYLDQYDGYYLHAEYFEGKRTETEAGTIR